MVRLRGAARLLGSWLVVMSVSVGAAVPRPGGEPDCSPDEYRPDGLERCCKQCPPGAHVSRHCDANHGVPLCSPCEPGTFLAHGNGQTSCQPCTTCRADQEVLAACTQTSDRQCGCRTGSFYCDSLDCVEQCLRCRSSGDQKSEPRGQQGHAPAADSREGPCLASSSL